MKYIIIHGDVRDVLSSLKLSFTPSVVITDPPYPELEKHRAIGTTTRLTKKWFPVMSWDELQEVFRQIYYIADKNAHLYVWGNAESIFNAKEVIEDIGWKFWNIIVWNKKRIGMGYHYRNTVEFLLFFEKGKKKLRFLNLTNYFEEKVEEKYRRLHPAFKPVFMQAKIIANSCDVNGVVFDPFMGAGSTLLATHYANIMYDLNASYIGVEIEKEYCEIARRIAEENGIETELIEF